MDLSVEHVTKEIGAQVVLDDVSLRLKGGRVYGLRGKNGSGKTMLLRALCGLIVPTDGRVVMDGEILGEDGRSFPKSVGTLIEEPGVIRNYSGMRFLREVASIKGIATERGIAAMMLRLGLDPLSRKPIKGYSLGMRQKIGIICALMEHPDLILLDEPFNGLDEISVNAVIEMIREERERGALVVIASHDIEELTSLADVVYTVRSGRVALWEAGDGAQ